MLLEDIPTYVLYLVLGIVVVVPVGLMLFVRYFQQKDAIADIKTLVCLVVSIPRESAKAAAEQNKAGEDFKDLISPMEQFLASLTTIIHQKHFIDWLFSTPAHVSFEIASVGGVTQFSIICPKRIKTIVERQLHSFFPTADVQHGSPPAIFSASNPAVAGAVFRQAKNFILPIKTYRTMDADPLSALTTALTKLPNNSGAGIQLLIRPTNESWRTHTHIASQHVSENRLHLVNRSSTGRIVGNIAEAIKPASTPATDTGKARQFTPQQEELMRALQEKGSKTGFEAVIRLVATGPTRAEAEANLTALISAFSQFYAPQFNSFKYKKLTPDKISRDYLLRLFSNAPKMILNVEELSSIFHLPNRLLDTPGLKWQTAKTLPPPTNLPATGVVIGESIFRGATTLVRLKEDDRRRHVFMIGKTGTGKTTLFETMIEQDMHAGRGVCFIDPLGDAIENLLGKVPTHRAKDVILFDPSDTAAPLGLNLLEFKRPEERDFLIQEVIEIFYKLFDPNRTGIVGPQWEHWARNAALTVMAQPGGGTLIDLPRLFTDDAFRERAIANVTDPTVKAFWQQQLAKTADFHKSEMYNYFISKFGRFMTNDLMRNIIGQSVSSFNFREVMDSGKILFINLAKGKIGEINANLLGLIIVSKLQVAAFSRADIPEERRRDFYLYVDEFQNFTTDTFATILAEARKYRLSLNITNQYFAQLTERIRDAVIGNVGTLISYRIGADDAEYLAHELPSVSSEDLANLDRFQAYVKLLIDLNPTRPFNMRGVKSPNQSNPAMASWIKQASRTLYGRKAT
ncbi:MAG: type IV secretion system DNA-binding domain-containing protein [Patescibacteria group bacterium]